MRREELRQVDRVAGEDAEHEEAEDHQHHRVPGVGLEPEIEEEAGGDGA
jgi:hypothetical protein